MRSRTLAGIAGLVLAGTAAAFGLSHVQAQEGTISGYARVIDGDSLVVAGQRVRLFGIDAVELHQSCGSTPCGFIAKATLERLIGNAPVTCIERDRDRFGRSVAVCRSVGGDDLGGLMVGLGWATAYRRYSLAYVDHEDAARAERLGIWATGFQAPEQYRREHPRR